MRFKLLVPFLTNHGSSFHDYAGRPPQGGVHVRRVSLHNGVGQDVGAHGAPGADPLRERGGVDGPEQPGWRRVVGLLPLRPRPPASVRSPALHLRRHENHRVFCFLSVFLGSCFDFPF